MLAKATSAPENQEHTTRLRAKINYLRSVNLDTSRSAKDRQELAVAASRMLDASRITSTLDRAWIAEMKFMVDTKQAKSLAWESVQNYWSKGERDYQRPEELAAMLQCLLRSSNLKESQVFLSKRLPKLSTKDQSLLRKHSAMACVRAAVANSIQTSFQTEFESIPSAQLIDLAIQLDPESNELSRLILQIASANRENEFLRILVPELHADTTNLIGKLIDSISPEEQTTSETRLQDFSSFASTSSSHAIFAMRIVDTLLREKKLERAVAIDYLRTITDHFPSVLSAWSIRASLHSDQQELDQAIQCYEKMSEQLPANVEIKNAIQELRARQRENATPPS
jgi:tetratricopeptide (TPR) repeat protein